MGLSLPRHCRVERHATDQFTCRVSYRLRREIYVHVQKGTASTLSLGVRLVAAELGWLAKHREWQVLRVTQGVISCHSLSPVRTDCERVVRRMAASARALLVVDGACASGCIRACFLPCPGRSEELEKEAGSTSLNR